MLDSGNTFKYLDKCCGKFYNPKKLLTYNRPWNFIAGSRSIGKSTALAVFCLLDFIENQHKFIYSRRTKDECLLTCQGFFSNAVSIINSKTDLNIKNFKYEGQKYYISFRDNEDDEPEWVQCGCVIPLSIEDKYKSGNYSEYCNLIWDEFIPLDDTKYLGTKDKPDKEYVKLLSLYQTIDRGIDRPFRNETRFFMLGNTATTYNPIYLKLNISDYIVEGAKFIRPKGKLWILEQIDGVEATEEIAQSFAYQLSDEEQLNYAYKNIGRDKKHFIKKPSIARYHATVRLNGETYGIASDDKCLYITKPKEGYYIISLDIAGHKGDDLMLVNKWRESPIMVNVSRAFKEGRLFFYNGRAQQAFLKYLDYTY